MHRGLLTAAKILLSLIAFVLATTTAKVARAGNDDSVLLGNEAAMTGGAETAVVSDGTSIWYNPAGLANVGEDTVDVSGSVTMLRLAAAAGLLRSANGGQADGSYFELFSIPSAVTLVRNLGGGLHGAVGVFVPQLSDHTDRATLSAPTMDGSEKWQLVQRESRQSYYLGGSLGWKISPNVRVGFSVFGFYRTYAVSSNLAGAALNPALQATSVFSLASLITQQSVGIDGSLGVQWDVNSDWTLGISIRTPGIRLGSSTRATVSAITASTTEIPMFAAEDEEGLAPSFELETPARLRIGMAYRFTRGFLSIDGDVQHEINNANLSLSRKTVLGLRVGGVYALDEYTTIGAGFFTDLSPVKQVDNYGVTQVDFYGVSLGLEMHTPHRLAESERANEITFSSTFALRYAYGTGNIGGLSFRTGDQRTQADLIPVSTSIHELGIHIGSALHF